MKKNIKTAVFSTVSAISVSLLLASCSSSDKGTLQELIREGKTEDAKSLFSTQDVNEIDEEGNSGLHTAAMFNEAELVNFLLLKGANSELKNKNGDTPLHLATKNNSVNSGAALINFKANIFEKDSNGKTALEIALEKGENWYPVVINQQTEQYFDEDGQSIIHYFVKSRNEKAIDYAIEKKINLSIEDKNKKTPLMIAYESPKDYESMKIAAKLIMANAKLTNGEFSYFEQAVLNHNPIYRFDDGQTPLHIAAILGHDGIVDYILKSRTTVPMEKMLSAKDISGSTPLHEAVRYGNTEIAEKLIKSKANIDSLDAMGNTPLLLLMPKESQKKLYTLLISNNAYVSQKDTFGDSVLHKATMSETSVDILKFLVENGAFVNERNKEGVTPLAMAIDNGIKEHITFYAKNGADIYASDKNGLSPIGRALKRDSLDILSTLITRENVNTKDSNGNTPLHLAILNNSNQEVITYLIDIGADVNARNSMGDSVLFMAAQKNRKEAGLLLLAKNADIFATNISNNSPLRIAFTTPQVQDWFINSQTLLMRDGSGNSPLHYAAEWKYDNSVNMLIEKKSDINAVNANGESAVFAATRGNSPSIIKILVNNGAIVDSRNVLARDNLGNTPLHTSIRWNSIEAAKTLLSYGVDVDAQNLNGRTALNDACKAGKKDLAVLLIDKGANVNSTDSEGKTVLMDAVQSQNVDMIKLLLNNGANANIQDLEGQSAYHEAAKTQKIDIINLIRNAGGNPLSRASNRDTPLSLVFDSDESVIKAVLGNDKSIVDSDGNTPIHIAVEKKVQKNILTMLLNSGYPVSQRNGKGMTALNIAVNNDSRVLAMTLIEYGADPYLASNDGENPITNVIKKKNFYLLEEIVKHNKTKTDKQGDSILHYAARYADEETTKKLVELGLNKNAKNISGETPSKMAARWGRTEIAEILK